MAGEENTHPDDRSLTEDQAERILAGMNEVIRAGEEMRGLRTELIQVLAGLGWSQSRIARLTEMSQPAVSKQVAKHGGGDPRPALDVSLDQHDLPWLEGRLWGLAEEVSETLAGAAHCTGHVTALARGRRRFTPQGVDELRRLLEADLRAHRDRLPGSHRAALDAIGRALDVPVRAPAAAAATTSASVRRTLARQIQRDRLREERGSAASGG
ncbi:sigma-70 family RNA polymerase sigma factor [Kitasatospora sp. NPDC059327]|uniref:sigma-70 family RNA polymerase sigma factor n=1 Tax=Kitasatospora sp. NPDC059327 TaxID=3346803 RepID=UPI0036CFA607